MAHLTENVALRPARRLRTSLASFGRHLSPFLRRTHMYIGLFAAPWLLMYALSTLVFNHAAQVSHLYERIYGPAANHYVVERKMSYGNNFPPGATLRTEAEEILAALHLDGSFGVQSEDDRLVITRRDPFIPRRITFNRGTHTLLIERQDSRLPTILTTLHTQVSYTNRLKRIKAWAFSVDLTAATMLLLVISGVCMWWELKVTHRAGAVFLVGGALLFCLFLFLA